MPALDLEAEYNNRARVPEHPALLAAWTRDAAAWRAACPRVELGLPYGTREREKLDLFWPSDATDAPIALFIHGGYWQALNRDSSSHCARGLNLNGVAVAVPSYDLCPHVPLATIVDQMRAAADLLKQRHGRPLLAIGHSAGGQLAAMLLASGHAEAALPISGVFELEPVRLTSIGTALRLDATEAHRLSPRYLPSPGRPIHCLVGGDESPEYQRQTRDMAAAWSGSWEALPGQNHFTVVGPLADPDSPMVSRAKALVPA